MIKQLLNSAFLPSEELWRSRRALSASALRPWRITDSSISIIFIRWYSASWVRVRVRVAQWEQKLRITVDRPGGLIYTLSFAASGLKKIVVCLADHAGVFHWFGEWLSVVDMLSNVLVCFTYFGSGRGNFVLCFPAYTMKLSCIPSVVKLLSSLLLASIVQKVDNVIYRINFCSVNNAISFPNNYP